MAPPCASQCAGPDGTGHGPCGRRQVNRLLALPRLMEHDLAGAERRLDLLKVSELMSERRGAVAFAPSMGSTLTAPNKSPRCRPLPARHPPLPTRYARALPWRSTHADTRSRLPAGTAGAVSKSVRKRPENACHKRRGRRRPREQLGAALLLRWAAPAPAPIAASRRQRRLVDVVGKVQKARRGAQIPRGCAASA